ncbi:MAG TPA: cupredoxin domain-containing protein [Candidatus Thermoplasmatota archaeon]|nr:cupredoxin domain-containing protein [Candidatus Thermoplasmatota archaeon]
MRVVALVALLTFALIAGCSDKGGSDDGTTTAPTTTMGIAPQPDEVSLSVAATGAFPANPVFDPATLQVPAGAMVNLTFSNEDLILVTNHNWVIDDISGASTDSIAPGEQTTITFTAPLAAGDHAYYCSITGHRERGMEGTLSVTVA